MLRCWTCPVKDDGLVSARLEFRLAWMLEHLSCFGPRIWLLHVFELLREGQDHGQASSMPKALLQCEVNPEGVVHVPLSSSTTL